MSITIDLAVLQTKIDVFKKSASHTTAEYDALIAVFEKQVADFAVW